MDDYVIEEGKEKEESKKKRKKYNLIYTRCDTIENKIKLN